MNTSVNVLMINAQGIMLSVLGRDYFLSYNRVPWLKDWTSYNLFFIKYPSIVLIVDMLGYFF